MISFSKILVANRGEIAVRVMRTAADLGYATVAVYSDADRGALHTRVADEAVCLGGLSPAQSYLDINKVIAAAKSSGADAIHPGYGFLSENTEFASACAEHGITFIGPPASAIELMGSKRLSKIAMLDSDVPCIPGYQGEDQSTQTLVNKAQEIGAPLMIKASAGGGGRGMRLVHDLADLERELQTAKTEAKNAFGSDEVILERAVIEPRHIEIQVFADQHGNVVHLGERDCSIQRRHQKVVEESPSPFVDAELRKAMGSAAVNAAKACRYVGAGTVEFLVDASKNFYFLEMNTRLQVEHPVTEMVTNTDLVAWQIKVAEGQPLPLKQEEIALQGHAVEVRVYAEDPRDNFMPQTGTVFNWSPATQLRADAGIANGQDISPFYDPMLAKLIACGENREVALRKLAKGLGETVLLGINHNLQFLQEVIENKEFIESGATTAFLQEQYPDGVFQDADITAETIAMAAVALYRRTQYSDRYLPQAWSVAVPATTHFLLAYGDSQLQVAVQFYAEQYHVRVADEQLSLRWRDGSEHRSQISIGAHRYTIATELQGDSIYLQNRFGHHHLIDLSHAPAASLQQAVDTEIKANMDGAIVEVNVAAGDRVSQGQVLVVLEAMKMAHQFKSGISGVVADVAVQEGEQVKARQLLVTLEED